MNRKEFLKRSIIGTAALGGLTGLYSWQLEPHWVDFTHHKMEIDRLPPSLDGKTLVQISDIHIGERFNYSYIIDTFKRVQKMAPDIIVYTGDFVSYEDKNQFRQLREVMEFAPKGVLGSLAILGNHDYGHGWAQPEVAHKISGILFENDIRVLRNEVINVNGLNIIGLDDYWATNFSPESILTNESATDTHLVLCHNPDVCDLDVWHGYQGWILAGHTHGGQVKPPFLPPPILPVRNKRYSSGRIELEDGRTLYINRALGHLHQVRFNVRPEVTFFELKQNALT